MIHSTEFSSVIYYLYICLVIVVFAMQEVMELCSCLFIIRSRMLFSTFCLDDMGERENIIP